MKGKRRFFYTFLVSYVATLIVPILVFTFAVYGSIGASFLEEVVKRNQYGLEDVRKRLDVQIGLLETIAQQVRVDTDFSTYRLSENGGHFYAIEEKLRTYDLTNDFADAILFASNSTGLVYGPQTHALRRYCSQVIVNPNYRESEYLRAFSAATFPVWIPMSTVTLDGAPRVLTTYVVPVERSRVDSDVVRSTLIFHIGKAAFEHICSSLLLDPTAKVSISMDEAVVYESDPTFFEAVRRVDAVGDRERSFSLHRLSGAEYYAFSTQNTAARPAPQIRLFVSSTAIKNETRNIVLVSLAALAASLSLGLIVIVVAIRYNYAPISRLAALAARAYRGSVQDCDEVERTRNALEKLIEDNSAMRELTSQHSREKLLAKLVSNTAGDREVIMAECRRAGITIEDEYYACCIIQVEFAISNDRLFDRVEFYAFLNAQHSMYCTELDGYDTLILVVGCEFDDFVYVEKVTKSLIAGFFDSNGVRLGVGNFVGSILGLNQSYCQALIALSHASKEGRTRVFFHELPGRDVDTRQYSRDDLTRLYQAILHVDCGKIRRRIDGLIRSLRSWSQNEYVWTYIAHDIVNTCIQALDELGIPTDRLFTKYSYILHSTDFSSVDHVIRVMEQLTSELLDTIESVEPLGEGGRDGRGALDIDEVTAYLSSHFADPTFSVKMAASEFGTSISNLSHFFKSRTGRTISEHTNDLRMEEAKRLLLNTDLTIAQIVSHIGGLHASSFIRNFKKRHGVTPGEYRTTMNERRT